MIQVLSSNGNEYPAQCVMCNTEFVQKLAFAYRNCLLSLETTNILLLVDKMLHPEGDVQNLVTPLTLLETLAYLFSVSLLSEHQI